VSKVYSSTRGDDPKAIIKTLAARLKEENQTMIHSHCLEVVSQFLIGRNWNTLSALCTKDPTKILTILRNKLGQDSRDMGAMLDAAIAKATGGAK
jgi:hypothetical protein